jgi:hypothetical protein
MVALGQHSRRLLATVPGWLVVHTMACGTASPPVAIDGGSSDGGEGADVSAVDSSGPLDSLGPTADAFDPTFCTRTSDDCYIFPEDCCNSDCATATLIPVSGGGGRGDYFRSCMERGCTPCAVSSEWVPRCIGNHCTIVELGSSSFSACSTNEDCQLRWGSRCCELCHPNAATDLVSAARTAAFCEPDDGCDPCLPPPFPQGVGAICVDGHCKVQR